MTRERFPLTRAMQRTLDAIIRLTRERNICPSYAELCADLGFKSNGRLSQLLLALKQRGHVDWVPNMARSIKVLPREGVYPVEAALVQRLEGFCAVTGERPIAVIHDALALHLDAMEVELANEKQREATGGGR